LPPVKFRIAKANGGNIVERIGNDSLFPGMKILFIPSAQKIRQDRIRRETVSILSVTNKYLNSLIVPKKFLKFRSPLNND
jgi:hypothetical protein